MQLCVSRQGELSVEELDGACESRHGQGEEGYQNMKTGDKVWVHSYGYWRSGTVVKVARVWATVSYVANVTTGRVNEKAFRISEIQLNDPKD